MSRKLAGAGPFDRAPGPKVTMVAAAAALMQVCPKCGRPWTECLYHPAAQREAALRMIAEFDPQVGENIRQSLRAKGEDV